MGIESIGQHQVYTTTTKVSAQPPPLRPERVQADPVRDLAMAVVKPAPAPPSDHAAMVKDMLDRIGGPDVKSSLGKARLKQAMAGADGSRKLGWFKSQELQGLRRDAEKAMAELQKVDVGQWKDLIGKDAVGSKAEKAVQKAIQTQFALAAGLRARAAEAGGDPALNILAHEAEMRGCEIARLAAEAAHLDDSNAPKPVLHSTQMGVEIIRGKLDGLVSQLEKVLNNPRPGETGFHLAQLDLQMIRTEIADVRRNGLDMGDGRRLMVEDRVLAGLESQVAELESRLADFGQNVTRNVARKFVNELLYPDTSALKSQLPPEMLDKPVRHERVADPVTGESKRVPVPLHTVLAKLEASRDRVLEFVEGKSTLTENDRKLLISRNELAELAFALEHLVAADEQLAENSEIGKFIARLKVLSDFDRNDASGLFRRVAEEGRLTNLTLEHSLDHLVLMMEKAQDSAAMRKFVTGADLRSALKGDEGFSKIVEIRLHGFEEGDLDPVQLTHQSKEEVGKNKGGVNSVSIFKFSGPAGAAPTFRVFKPEGPARYGMGGATPLNAYSAINPDMEALHLNLASHEVADLLGCGGRIGKTYVAVHDGVVGMSMEMAPGCTTREAYGDATTKDGEKRIRPVLQRMVDMSDDELRVAKGNVAQQLNQLQWIDLINGQVDRHDGNWLLDVSADGKSVSVTGIDNDYSFSDKMVGMGKFKLSAHEMDDVLRQMLTYKGGNADGETLRQELFGKGVTKQGDGYVINLAEMSRLARSAAITAVVGSYGKWNNKVVAVPTSMDYRIYARIVQLTNEPNCQTFRNALAKRHLSSSQIEAAVLRLQDARKAADKLREEQRVFRDDDWANADLQRELDNPSTPDADEVEAGFPGDKQSIEKDMFALRLDACDYFNRNDGGMRDLLGVVEEMRQSRASAQPAVV